MGPSKGPSACSIGVEQQHNDTDQSWCTLTHAATQPRHTPAMAGLPACWAQLHCSAAAAAAPATSAEPGHQRSWELARFIAPPGSGLWQPQARVAACPCTGSQRRASRRMDHARRGAKRSRACAARLYRQIQRPSTCLRLPQLSCRSPPPARARARTQRRSLTNRAKTCVGSAQRQSESRRRATQAADRWKGPARRVAGRWSATGPRRTCAGNCDTGAAGSALSATLAHHQAQQTLASCATPRPGAATHLARASAPGDPAVAMRRGAQERWMGAPPCERQQQSAGCQPAATRLAGHDEGHSSSGRPFFAPFGGGKLEGTRVAMAWGGLHALWLLQLEDEEDDQRPIPANQWPMGRTAQQHRSKHRPATNQPTARSSQEQHQSQLVKQAGKTGYQTPPSACQTIQESCPHTGRQGTCRERELQSSFRPSLGHCADGQARPPRATENQTGNRLEEGGRREEGGGWSSQTPRLIMPCTCRHQDIHQCSR